MKIGMLTIISRGPDQMRKTRSGVLPTWICRCDCGRTKIVLEQNLKQAHKHAKGGARSCGCLLLNNIEKHGASTRQGQPATPEYNAWLGAKKRCYNSRNPSYQYYGGRGIGMCEEWRYDFLRFLNDMGKKPPGRWILDRKDNNLDYAPANCRWATPKISNMNKMSVTIYEMNGELYTIIPLSEKLGITESSILGLIANGSSKIKIAKKKGDSAWPND